MRNTGITNTKRLVGTALFSALSYAISFLEFPIFPALPFLKLDFSLVFILLCGFMFGAVYGVSASAVKELLCFLTKSSTGGIGELANFVITISFILLPTIFYQFKKGLPLVTILLCISIIVEIIMALLSNRFIMFPLYMGSEAKKFFYQVFGLIALFNFIKMACITVLTLLCYKRLSKFVKWL